MLESILTATTCGETCWSAREEICRCSCGGKNHGCLKTEGGTRPVRMAKLDGVMYELRAAGPDGMYGQASLINKAAGPKYTMHGYTHTWYYNDKGAPARVKRATKDQVAKWPELESFRQEMETLKLAGDIFKVWRVWPYLLWVKSEKQLGIESKPEVV